MKALYKWLNYLGEVSNTQHCKLHPKGQVMLEKNRLMRHVVQQRQAVKAFRVSCQREEEKPAIAERAEMPHCLNMEKTAHIFRQSLLEDLHGVALGWSHAKRQK